MCLDRLSADVKTKYGKQRTGYKVFLCSLDNDLICTDQGSGRPKPRGEWLDEASYRSAPYKFNPVLHLNYRLGFHVCLTRSGANAWARMVRGNHCTCKVVKVAFKYPVAWGYQRGEGIQGYPMAVAKQIKIE